MTIQREIRRKSFHLLAGLGIPVIYYVFMLLGQQVLAKWILLAATVSILVIDLIRLKHMFARIIFLDIFGPLLRKHEISALTGATYLMISSLVCFYMFRDSVALLAISYLVIGDSLAAIVGRSIGRPIIFGKSLEGSVAGLLGCLVIGSAIMLLPGTSLGWAELSLGAVVAMAVELLPIPLDDNIRIPLASGAIMHLLF
jgi:dolichol kinase